MDPQATPSQHNILLYKRKRIFSRKNVRTVGKAMHVWLRGTGYRLSNMHPDQNVYQLLQLSLPEVHRKLGTVSIEEGLKALAGDPWELVIDPVHRMVSFRLPDAYVQPMLVMPAASATQTVSRRTGRVAHTKSSSASRRKTKRCRTLFCNVKTTSTLDWIH
jgi:conjugative transfer region protein (TIGR03748 family)